MVDPSNQHDHKSGLWEISPAETARPAFFRFGYALPRRRAGVSSCSKRKAGLLFVAGVLPPTKKPLK